MASMPLFRAVVHEDLADVRSQLGKGADVNARDSDEMTALHWARTPSIVSALIDAGADVHARDKWGGTPLHSMAWAKPTRPSLRAMRTLVGKGADVNALDQAGGAPLHWAAWHAPGTTAAVLLLVELGADPSLRDHDGETALDVAKRKRGLED